MRVLFTTTPGRGHFHPMVPLALAVQDAGHDVAWVARRDVAARLNQEGFEAMAGGMDLDAAFPEFQRRFPQLRSMAPQDRPDFMFPRLFGAVFAPPMLADLLPIAREWRPDLLVCDQAELAGPVVAATLGVPNATHAFGHLLPAARVASATEQVAPLWQAQGLEPRPYAGTYDHLYLDIYPPSLQTAETGHLAAMQPLRPTAFATAGGDDDLDPWRGDAADNGDPLVYVTFGTVFTQDVTIIATVVRALRDLPVRVVATLGPAWEPSALGEQPPNVHVASYIPQTDVLPLCSAVISHAGSGTFLAALGHGLPQVLVPQAADQFLNAAAGARSGAAVAIAPGELTEDAVREAAQRILAEPAFRAAAEDLSSEIREMPSPENVVSELARRFG